MSTMMRMCTQMTGIVLRVGMMMMMMMRVLEWVRVERGMGGGEHRNVPRGGGGPSGSCL